MMSWNSLILCWNSSRVGKAISESSLIGVPSCFSGGRRMVKCTRSTLASDFSRLRQVRSPACGSPETSSTRSLSRTPSIDTTARLLTGVSSPSSADASISTMLAPAWGIGICTLTFSPLCTLRLSKVSPSRRTVTCAGPGGTPESSTRNTSVWLCPTMPKRGADMSTTRRSRSSGWPVISACTGAAKPSAAASPGTSCTRPSVTRTAPATRSGGTSASAAPSAENSRVPSVSPSASPASTTRVSSPGMRASRCASAARTASVCASRSPNPWLGLLSMITTATEDSGWRSSRVKEGLASASASNARPAMRSGAPRLRMKTRSPATNVTAAKAAHSTSTGTSGANAIPKSTDWFLLPEPLEQRRDVHLIGLVVAGQRVHHDVDPCPKGELALARIAGHQRQHRLTVGLNGPGAGKVVGSDENGRDAVAAAGGATRFVLAFRRHGFDPKLAEVEAPGKIAKQKERLGQHVVAGNRLEPGNVERGENRAQCLHARPAAFAARPGRRRHGVARIEQDGAALLHVGVGPRQCLGRGPRRVRHHRPIDQRKKCKLVAADVDPDRLARLERGTLRQEQGQALQPGLAGGVDIGVPGDHVGEPRLQRALHGEIIGDRIGAAAADPAAARRRGTSRCQPPPSENTTSESIRSNTNAVTNTMPRRSLGSLSRYGSIRAASGERSIGASRSPAASVLTASSASGGP